MAKKIKFPLEMTDGIQVRTLEDLQEHFDIEKVLGYFLDGKLITWLNDRYYEKESEQIAILDSSTSEFRQQLCEILGVQYSNQDIIDLEEIELKNYRLNKIKQFTDDIEAIANIDRVAFDQEELADLLDCSTSIIYLCGEKFTIPLSKEHTTYIGVNNPVVFIKSNIIIDFNLKDIKFENVKFNEEYNKLVIQEENASVKIKHENIPYKTSELIDYMIKSNERASSERLFNIIQGELRNIEFDMNKFTKSNYEILIKSDLNNIFKNYLNNIAEEKL